MQANEERTAEMLDGMELGGYNSGDWKKSFKALCMLTGIHDLYDILLDSWEGDEIYGINWDTPVTINGHTYSVVRNNGLNVYGSSGVTYSIRCAH